MPLLLAGFTIAVTFGVLYFVARQAELSIFILDASMMLGIGLGIDFALIFVSRFREELQKDAQHIVSAVLQTMRTAGHAIFYSSLTTMGAMSALLIVEIAAIRAMALGIIVTVFILLLLSMSFLPAVVAIMGSKINACKIPSWGRKAHANRWYKMSHRVMKRPLLYIAIFTSVLGLLAWPSVQLQTSTPDVRMLPEGIWRDDWGKERIKKRDDDLFHFEKCRTATTMTVSIDAISMVIASVCADC